MLLNKNYRSIICLNGELPAKAFFNLSLPIIAADGALNQLSEMNIKPNMVIGDFDSVDKALLQNFPSLHLPNQSSSDFEKCFAYVKEKKLMPAIIVGLDGGCLDHVLNNLNFFTSTESMFYTRAMKGIMLHEGEHIALHQAKQTKISLFGLPSATLSTHGLKWDLIKTQLSFPGKNSSFNRTQAETVSIEIHAGNLLLLIYHEPIDDGGIGSVDNSTILDEKH